MFKGPKIYHNPRCSKSRATKALLESKEIEFEVVEYLKVPLNSAILTQLLKKLGLSAASLLRTNEAEFKQSGIDLDNTCEETLVELMVEMPKLIERPIVETDNAARIGRPPEQVLELFK